MIFRMLSSLLAALLLGRICIADAKCTDTRTETQAIAVTPAPQERRFFWIDADGKTAYAGVIAANAQSVALNPKAYVAVDTTLEGDASRGWPLDVDVTLGAAESQWKWKLSADEAKRLRRLYVPADTYWLNATVAHHQQLIARLVAKEGPVKLALRFTPSAELRGVIADADDKAIAGATVTFANGAPCAITDEKGAFTCELPQRFPEAAVVSNTGYALRELMLNRGAIRDQLLDLGRIRLTTGRTLTVKVMRPEAAPARVALLFDSFRSEHTRMKTVMIAEKEETVRFDAGEGDYYVVVEGEEPLERLEVAVKIQDADVEKEILVEPFELAGSVKFGGQPLMDGELEVIAPRQSWRVPLPVTAGTFRAILWQKGSLHAWLKAPELTQGEFLESPELGANPSRWDIAIEKRMIVGRVVDALTKAPVPDAEMAVEAEFADSAAGFSATVRSDGTYEILAAEPGTYTLKADSPNHMLHTSTLQITADDRVRTHDIALQSGLVMPVDVMGPGGAPLPMFTVFDGGLPRGSASSVMQLDERGHGELRGMPGSSRVLFFEPTNDGGSFAVARVQFPRTAAEMKPLQVVVPPPCCTLRVRSVAADGQQPFRGVVLLRYNGEFIPRIAAINKEGEAVRSNLPAGTYEIWIVGNPFEDPTSRKPAKVGLSSGEAVVTVVAAR